jgi:large subunit ribosomal protein L24
MPTSLAAQMAKAGGSTARPNKLHVKKGDRVIVITGKDRGVTGRIIEAYPRTQRVLVEGVNRIKKHTKVGSTARGVKTGGIVTQEAPIHASNVMLAVEVEGKTVGTRIGYRVDDNGNKVRYAKRTGEDI